MLLYTHLTSTKRFVKIRRQHLSSPANRQTDKGHSEIVFLKHGFHGDPGLLGWTRRGTRPILTRLRDTATQQR